jgi:NADH-quinone oxidoreductase subunit M
MDFFREHYLSIITFLPAAGALVMLLPPFGKSDTLTRWFANGVAMLGFLVSVPLWFWFDRSASGFQFVEKAEWIPSIGVSYHFGIDGISALLILLTTLLGVVGVLCSWSAITERVRQYYVFLLLLQTGMLGVFCALDMFLFYVFWEVMLVPMYLLIGIWGGQRRLYASIKFVIYTMVGSKPVDVPANSLRQQMPRNGSPGRQCRILVRERERFTTTGDSVSFKVPAQVNRRGFDGLHDQPADRGYGF